jgi:hypothetical protein
MLRNILSISSDLLSNVFFLSESLDSIAEYASGTDPETKFPRSAMIFTQQKSFNRSSNNNPLAEGLYFDKSLFSTPSYTVDNPTIKSPVPLLDLAFSSLLVAHPLKSSHQLTKAITRLKRFHCKLRGLCSSTSSSLLSFDHLAETIGSVIDSIQTRGVESICRSVVSGIFLVTLIYRRIS